MEVVGGQGFYRSFGLERLFRDVQAAKYHPLQEKDQLQFTGEYILSLEKNMPKSEPEIKEEEETNKFAEQVIES
jgi:hypothetical protein